MSDEIVARLRKVRGMIGAMCHEGRPPKMSIPARPDIDEDIVISDAADDAADLIERLQAELTAERERAERNEKDADAAQLYGSTARGMGFVGVPSWSELAEKTRDTYRQVVSDRAKGRAAIDAAMEKP